MAATALAMKKVEIDTDILEVSLTYQEDEILQTFLLAACYAPHAAVFLVPRIAFDRVLDPVFSLRLLMVAARHEEARPAVMVALKTIDWSGIRETWGKEINELETIVR
jgi:hypothetical protein